MNHRALSNVLRCVNARIPLGVLLVAALATSCATTGSGAAPTSVAPQRRPPDVHGDPLSLLPSGAVMWARADAARMRASPHFDGAMALARDLGAEFDTVERELGFDPFRNAEHVAVAIYAPPGDSATSGWPLFYARGTFDRASMLARARQRPEAHGEQTEGVEEGIAYTTVGRRAYMFPAADVMLVMERGLVRRVAARLAGATDRTVLTDDRFTDLWREASGMDGAFAIAADLAAMRGSVHREGNLPEVEALERVVARGDARDAVSVRAVGRARNAAAAQQLVRTIDEARFDVAGQIPVRLLGLSRVLREGITTSADGDVVRASVDVTSDEARRLLRATSLMREFLGR